MKRVDVYAYHTMILIGTDFIIGSDPCFELIFLLGTVLSQPRVCKIFLFAKNYSLYSLLY